LSWTAMSGASSYQVYRAASLTGTRKLLGKVSSTTYADTSAAVVTPYYYWVKGCSGSICSGESNSDSGYRDPAAPSLSATDGTSLDKVGLSWGAVSGASSYEIYRTDDSSSDPLSGGVHLGSNSKVGSKLATSYSDATALPGITYYYWVMACQGTICGDFNTAQSGWRGIATPLISATDGSLYDKVSLSWAAVSSAGNYNVYRATSSKGSKTLLGNASETSYDDTSAVPGTVYSYWVTACSGNNCSTYSTLNTGWRNLTAISDLTASDGSSTAKVVLSWTAMSGASSYQVYRAASLAGTRKLLGKVSSTTYTDKTAAAATPYYYWVKGCSGSICSSESNSDSGYRN